MTTDSPQTAAREETATQNGSSMSTADLARGMSGQTETTDRETVPSSVASAGTDSTDSTGSDGAATSSSNENAPLFSESDASTMRSRWSEAQASFVDDPRNAVQQADALVAECIKRLADIFADERSKLEDQWSSGEQVDTETLRVALTRYRSFFDRLLSV